MPLKQPFLKALLFTLVQLLLAIAAANCQPSHSSAETSLQSDFQAAMAAEDSGDVQRALTLLIGLHKRHPGVFEIDESLGLLFAGQDDNAQALPLLEAAAQERPSSDLAHANYATALFKLHRNQQALAQLKIASRLNPANVATQQSLGQVLLEEHKPELAAAAFAAAMRLQPGNDDLVLSYATALLAAGQIDPAKQALASVADSQQSALAQSLLGEAEEKSGAYDRAARHYARALELEPSEANVWALGVEYLRHWTFAAAIAEFEAATLKFPQSERMKLGLAVGYFGNANYGKALPVFADLLKINPNNELYPELLGVACSVPMQEDKSRCGELVKFAQAHPDRARIDTYAASWLICESDSEEQQRAAQSLLDRALAADPKLADAHFQQGMLKQNQGDWKGSVGDLQAAIALKPNLAEAHYRLALAYGHVGRKQEGQSEIALQRQYAKQQQEDLHQRLDQVTRFIVDVHY
jgi:tetratricopeptide (TPR) repeat protein